MKLLMYISWPFISVDSGFVMYPYYVDEFTIGGNVAAELTLLKSLEAVFALLLSLSFDFANN